MVSKRTVREKSGDIVQKKLKCEDTSINHIESPNLGQKLPSTVIKTEFQEEIKTEIQDNHDSYKIEKNIDIKCLIVNEVDIQQMAWRKLACKPTQLRLDIVLKCGQSFRWTTPFKDRPDEYVGVLNSKLWILKQEPENILYKTIEKRPKIKDEKSCALRLTDDKFDKEDEVFLRNYFQLDVDLESLYSSWRKVDPVFDNISKHFTGVQPQSL